jgi:hypothetical protein
MTPSFASAPPSNEFGKAKVLFNELGDLAVLFRELLLLARWRSLSERDTYSSGRCLSGADRLSLSRSHSKSPLLNWGEGIGNIIRAGEPYDLDLFGVLIGYDSCLLQRNDVSICENCTGGFSEKVGLMNPPSRSSIPNPP